MVPPASPAMRAVFDACILLLEKTAAWMGITYVEINVWLFVVIMPGLLVLQALVIALLVGLLRRRKA
ncbi:MAG TPA: hypothetical protein VFX50_14675 [Gemmatimonadales bacterium]|nr:hypothetical protein [Gemmatimonadales bacterium]